jgi:RNA polymerase sigma factor (sigma-70 family)
MAGTSGDQLLVERAQRGDRRAFDLLVLKYQQKIVNLVMRYVRDPTEALDVSQEAFVKAYRALPGFRGESAFYTWLYRIAINTAKNSSLRPAQACRVQPDAQDPEYSERNAQLRDEEFPRASPCRSSSGGGRRGLRPCPRSCVRHRPAEIEAPATKRSRPPWIVRSAPCVAHLPGPRSHRRAIRPLAD